MTISKNARIHVEENISVVNFNDVPATHAISFFSELFSLAAQSDINIDMISGAPATSDKISFGFTFCDDDMPKLLSMIKKISTHDEITPLMNVGNVKVTIKSDEMIAGVGFAAAVFEALKEIECLPLLMSTGSDEISLLIYESDRADLVKKLNERFN